MSTKNLRSVLQLMREDKYPNLYANALAELEAIERAAKDLTRLHVSDGVDDVAHREHVIAAMTTPESQWEHPDVRTWSDAALLLERIAKEAP